MFIELHILQNVAPASVDLSKTWAPKSACSSGAKRGLVSWQTLRRNMQRHLMDLFDRADAVATPTRRGPDLIADRLIETHSDLTRDLALRLGITVLGAAGITTSNAAKCGRSETAALIVYGADAVTALANIAYVERGTLLAAKPDLGPIAGRAKDALSHSRAIEPSLFGRTEAERSRRSIDRVVSVADPIVVTALVEDIDCVTALDDLTDEDEPGTRLVGTVRLECACYYRHANLHVESLLPHLGLDRTLDAIALLIREAALSTPAGQERNFTAPDPSIVVLVIVRDGAATSLANAFQMPVRPSREHSIYEAALLAMDHHHGRLTRMDGTRELRSVAVTTGETIPLVALKDALRVHLDDVIAETITAVRRACEERERPAA